MEAARHPHPRPMVPLLLLASWIGLCAAMAVAEVMEPELPDGFVQEKVVGGLESPAAMGFGPDDRLYISERVTGRLRIVEPDGTLLDEPLLTVGTPREEDGELPDGRGYMSAGLRGFAFHPNFPERPYLYVFYMPDEPRHNRLSRFRIAVDDAGRPLHADPDSEQVLIELPFADSRSSGSHNGGAVLFGDDGMLYFTTGDGWVGGDPVQRLDTYTGKVFRLHADGAIPKDNPFHDEAAGPLRAIYAIGLRNPYTMALHPETGDIYVNDCAGRQKTHIHKLRAGANFGFVSEQRGYGSQHWEDHFPGEPTEAMATAAIDRTDSLITGGAWYPNGGPFPEEYHGSYLTALWGLNGPFPGAITRMKSAEDATIVDFARPVGLAEDPDDTPTFITSALKPVHTLVGPDGHLYWLATTYRTARGAVLRIRYDR